jgi:murein DD-endopeptidase MepM/ murein hydrolase activator NlpD
MRVRSLFSALPLALTLAFAMATPAPAAAPAHQSAGAYDAPLPGSRVYKLPFAQGTTFSMCQGHNQGSHTENGEYAWDFCMPIGTPVLAARGGTVKFVQQQFTANGQGAAFADKNNYVVIDHGDGTSALYMHVMHDGVTVKVGQKVNSGDLIAYSGNTGWSSGPHTHFMVMQSSAYDYYAPSMPVAFVDVPGDGVPTDGQRVTSGNAAIDPSLLLPPCDSPNTASTSGFKPYWVENFKPSTVWSGSDGGAVSFGGVDSWNYFQVLAPQSGSRLLVRVAATGGTAYVAAGDVGPSGPPPVNGSCRPSGTQD